MHCVGCTKSVDGSERGGELGDGLICRSQIQPSEEGCKGLDLGLGMVTHRLDEQLGDQEHRPCAGNRAGLRCRLRREEGPDAPAQWVTRYRRIDQDVCVEGVHRVLVSAPGPSRCHPGDELLGALEGQVRGPGKSGGAPAVEDVAESLRISEGPVSPTNPNRVRPNDHRDSFAVAGDGHFLTREHTVEDLGQSGPGLAGRHRRHARDCTATYRYVQSVRRAAARYCPAVHPVDHVMVVVADLDDAVRTYDSHHGLAASPGGRHTGLGTANAIVPLGDDYIELIAVVDAGEAAGNPVGRYLSQRLASDGEGLVAVCLRTADPAGTAERTASPPVPMSRARPDGRELKWELLGMEGALVRGLPFFITWALDADHPARTAAEHPSGAYGIAWVEVGGDPTQVRDWVGSDEPQLRLVGDDPGQRQFAVATPAGEITLG